MSKNQIFNLLPDGYGRLVQYINGKFFDGFGNQINLQTGSSTNQSSLSSLKDVDVTEINDGDVLYYNLESKTWQASDPKLISTYSVSDSSLYLVLDNNLISVSKNPIKISFDFNFGELSYLYIAPDKIQINSFTSSTDMSVLFLVNYSVINKQLQHGEAKNCGAKINTNRELHLQQ